MEHLVEVERDTENDHSWTVVVRSFVSVKAMEIFLDSPHARADDRLLERPTTSGWQRLPESRRRGGGAYLAFCKTRDDAVHLARQSICNADSMIHQRGHLAPTTSIYIAETINGRRRLSFLA